MKAKFVTLVVRQHCGVFTASAQNVEMSGVSATTAARAAGAAFLQVPAHLIEVDVVVPGVLRASVKRPTAAAWPYLITAGAALVFTAAIITSIWFAVKGDQ